MKPRDTFRVNEPIENCTHCVNFRPLSEWWECALDSGVGGDDDPRLYICDLYRRATLPVVSIVPSAEITADVTEPTITIAPSAVTTGAPDQPVISITPSAVAYGAVGDDSLLYDDLTELWQAFKRRRLQPR